MDEFEVWLLVDSNGDYAVGPSDGAAVEDYEENIQRLTAAGGYRLVKLTVSVPLPAVAELKVVVPELGTPSAKVG